MKLLNHCNSAVGKSGYSQKYQFDPNRTTVDKMRELIEQSLKEQYGVNLI